ncbi:MAG: sirohydrochlorin chelatase [Nitrospiraceae bacterium]
MLRRSLLTLATVLVLGTGWSALAADGQSKPGFLVMAPDRGFLGNQELRSLVDEFKKSYPAALGLVGREYTGVDGEYAGYLTRAVQELKKAGATEIVAIPLFLSETDPLLKRITPLLPAYAGGLPVRWAPAMAHDYLIGQIVLDRVEALSEHPESERLILVGAGATDAASAEALKTDLDKLLGYVKRYRAFQEAETVVYYDRAAENAEQQNKDIEAHVLAQAAKQGRTLLVPAFIGPKFDHAMALTNWLGGRFKQTHIVYKPNELLPHPNALLWLKKTANRETPPVANALGVVVMPHGSTQPWTDAVETTIKPLMTRYSIEMAYGMGDPEIIQGAVARLEQRGVRRIVFVRMYALDHQMKPLTDYILGLSEHPPASSHGSGHDHGAAAPAQVRSAALFSTFGGYEQNPDIAQVLHKRIVELSQDPANETVLLLAHGEATDEGNEKWLAVMKQHIERLRQDPHCAKLKAVKALTVREDWPKEREQAVAAARAAVEDGGKHGRVLVIANRLYGSGPYKTMLKGLKYELNEKGLVDPILTRWLEDGLRRLTTEWTPLETDSPRIGVH